MAFETKRTNKHQTLNSLSQQVFFTSQYIHSALYTDRQGHLTKRKLCGTLWYSVTQIFMGEKLESIPLESLHSECPGVLASRQSSCGLRFGVETPQIHSLPTSQPMIEWAKFSAAATTWSML